jgi:microcystin-dependent protein
MATPFIGEIRIWAGNFAPTGWALCNGQVLPIIQNTTLFNIIGTAYGGDGIATFALPDLRGRVPIEPGQGTGLTNRQRGEAGGEEFHRLVTSEMPAHTHTLGAGAGNGNSDTPASRVLARSPAAVPQFAGSADVALGPTAVAQQGGDQPHNNLQPYLVLNFIIALQGVTPSHS